MYENAEIIIKNDEEKFKYVPPKKQVNDYIWEKKLMVNTGGQAGLLCAAYKDSLAAADVNYLMKEKDWYDMNEPLERSWVEDSEGEQVPVYNTITQNSLDLLGNPKYSSWCTRIQNDKTLQECQQALKTFTKNNLTKLSQGGCKAQL
jgi:hypothetical protein